MVILEPLYSLDEFFLIKILCLVWVHGQMKFSYFEKFVQFLWSDWGKIDWVEEFP